MRRALLLLGLCLLACSPDDAPPPTPGPVTPTDPIVQLRERVTSTYGDEQAKALSDLLKLGEPATETVRALLGRPEHKNEVLLALLRAPKMAGPLVEDVAACLSDEMMLVRWNAARVLGATGPSAATAVGALATALGDERFEVRIEAANALGAIGPDAVAAIPSLVAACEAEPIPKNSIGDPRAAALRALVAIGPPARPAVERIIPWAMRDDAPEMVKAARDAEIEVFPFRVLAEGGLLRRQRAAGVISEREIDPARYPDVLKLLSSASFSIQDGAVRCFTFQGEAALPFLEDAWTQTMLPRPRMELLRALAALGHLPGGALDFLEVQAFDSMADWRAIELLGELGERARPSVPALVRLLATKQSLSDRIKVIESLGRIGGEPAVEALVGLAEESAYAERILAIEALEGMGQGAEASVPALRTLTNAKPEKNLQVRAAAAIVRIRSGDRAAIECMVALTKSEDRTRRMAALDALAALGPLAKPALPHLEKIRLVPGDEFFFEAARRAVKAIRRE